MKVKSRHHLRSDEIAEIERAIAERTGVELDGDSYEMVVLADSKYDVVLVDGDPVVMILDDDPCLTVRGANDYSPSRNVVTVDAGAISFVSGGADVMRPGIVDADEGIDAGEFVLVAEETHGKVLAVGRALEAGGDMLGDSGKVVESIHHVGDELYQFSV